MINYFLIYSATRASLYGIGTYVNQLKKCISSQKNMRLFCVEMYADVKEYGKMTDSDGISYYQIPPIEKHTNESWYYRNVVYFLMLNVVSTKKCIFHFNSFKQEALLLYLKSHFINSRILFTVHYFNWCFLLGGNYSKFKLIVSSKWDMGVDEESYNVRYNYVEDCSFLRKCDEIIVLSKFAYSVVINDYKISPKKVHIIYNGIMPISYQKPFLNTSRNSVLFVGRLDEIKGVSYIIKAFCEISDKFPQIRLVFVGNGDFEKYFKLCESIREKVLFVGKVSHEGLEPYYQSACIGVQPSFHEQCSYSAIEMMMHGIPLIISDSTGLKEMMEECPENIVHIDELNFDEEDYVGQIAERMEKLLSNDSYRARVSCRMKKIFAARYTLRRMSDSMDKLIHGLFGKRYSTISESFLEDLDEKMVNIVNARPDMETGFSGIAGIGYYLWWRIQLLGMQKSKDAIYRRLWLEECVIYFLDWLEAALFYELNNEILLPSIDYGSIRCLLEKLRPIHPMQINMLIQLINMKCSIGSDDLSFTSKHILANVIKIYNIKI